LLKAQYFLDPLFRHTTWSNDSQGSDFHWSTGSDDSGKCIIRYGLRRNFNHQRFNNINLWSKMSIKVIEQLLRFELLLLLLDSDLFLYIHELPVGLVLLAFKFRSHALSWNPMVLIRREKALLKFRMVCAGCANDSSYCCFRITV